MIISVQIILVAQLFSVQGEVQIVLRYAELPAYDKEYLTEPDVYIYDDNKIFLNFPIIKQFPPTVEVRNHINNH
ncbi:hypothetical protein KQX54_009707 [Cotesia glomerata]|uniref:Uncharacterized protein n=1 Tax=Cotesia glomerata TaxID=32391 RepID=A0AAV7I1H8_COTGL|nr:hypothetical protein KQX54_009707 [Cotesia glomerata]